MFYNQELTPFLQFSTNLATPPSRKLVFEIVLPYLPEYLTPVRTIGSLSPFVKLRLNGGHSLKS